MTITDRLDRVKLLFKKKGRGKQKIKPFKFAEIKLCYIFIIIIIIIIIIVIIIIIIIIKSNWKRKFERKEKGGKNKLASIIIIYCNMLIADVQW